MGVITLRPAPPDDDPLSWARRAIDALAAAGVPVTFEGVEAGANVVMFVPFGVLVGLLWHRPWWAVVLLGSALSATIETVQRWLPTRYPTVQDVVMNTLGALVGVVALHLLLRRRAGRADARSRRAGSDTPDAG